jgi:hypothetical protein
VVWESAFVRDCVVACVLGVVGLSSFAAAAGDQETPPRARRSAHDEPDPRA